MRNCLCKLDDQPDSNSKIAGTCGAAAVFSLLVSECMILLMPWTGLFRTLDDAGRNLAKRGEGLLETLLQEVVLVFGQLFADVFSQNQEMLLGWHLS